MSSTMEESGQMPLNEYQCEYCEKPFWTNANDYTEELDQLNCPFCGREAYLNEEGIDVKINE